MTVKIQKFNGLFASFLSPGILFLTLPFLTLSLMASLLASSTSFASPTQPMADSIGQNLFLIGGGERPPVLLKKFVEHSGGTQARILVVTWATETPAESFAEISKDLKPYSPQKIVEVVRDPSTPESHREWLEQLQNCTGLYFTGGDQNRIMERLTAADIDLLKVRYEQGLSVAGTSAGTAVISPLMLTGRMEGPDPELRAGLGLLPLSILDTHFLVRSREERLIRAVLDNPDHIGIGVDEDNGIWVRDDRFVQPYGSSHLSLFRWNSAYKSIENIEVREGEIFDLSTAPSSVHGLR